MSYPLHDRFKNETIRKKLTQHLFSKSLMSFYSLISGDQYFLYDYVWSKEDFTQHNSVHCRDFNLSNPFTKAKLSNSHPVGCRRPCHSDQDPSGPCQI
jgi:hypothetical protein